MDPHELPLVIRTGYAGDVYLACPWNSDYNHALAWRLIWEVTA